MGLTFSQGDPEPPEPAGCAIIQEKFRYSSAREIPNTRLPAVFLGFPGTITRVFHCASRRYPPGPPECPGDCPGHGGSSAPASAAGRCKSVPPPAFQSKLNRIPFNESNESSFFDRQIRCGLIMVGRSAGPRGVPPGRGHPAPHEGVVGLLAPAFCMRPRGLG